MEPVLVELKEELSSKQSEAGFGLCWPKLIPSSHTDHHTGA